MDRRKTEEKTKKMPKALKVFWIVLADVVLLAACLLTFAYFHHVKPKTVTEAPIIIERPTETPAPATAAPDTASDTTPEPTAAPLTWAQKFADRFTDGEVIQTETSFISQNTHVTVTKHEMTVQRPYQNEMIDYQTVYYVADIYITDVEQFATAFPKDEYMPGAAGSTLLQIRNNNGVVGVNGDNYGSRGLGLVIRNGALYRQDLFEGDVMVLNYDGSMEPIFYADVDINQIIANGAYQAWSFGPVLLKDGQIPSNSLLPDYIRGDNPRTAIGYYEPGHYCMVVVEGRSDESVGLDVTEMSQLFYDLGCESAYNLDGGGTSAMVFNDEYVNVRADGGRHSTDTILILDPDYVKEGE